MSINGKTIKAYSVNHITIACRSNFDDTHASVMRQIPALDLGLLELLASGDERKISDSRANGPKLWLFLARDHGILLAEKESPAKAYQFEIGNPLTAVRMTRKALPAGLYAPLRVLLWEDHEGNAFFEYDQPSSLFGQFGDSVVTQVGLELDDEIEDALKQAAGLL